MYQFSVDELTVFIKLWTLFVAILGACIGSFLNVCIYRIPNNLSVVTPRSFCPQCRNPIPWYLNFPCISWLLLRGKSACCHRPIPIRYLLVELVTAALFLFVWAAWCCPETLHLTPIRSLPEVLVFWVILASLLVAALIDLDTFILPDRFTLGGMLFGLVCSAIFPELHHASVWWGGLIRSVLGLAVGFGLFWLIGILGERLFHREALGFGDVKLMGAVGACFGWKAIPFVLFVSAVSGCLLALVLLLRRKAGLRSAIPYGPHLVFATLVWMFWGEFLLGLYLTFALGIRS
ncbi:MAG: prepilin peptidase [Kiritimatiellia bacterium]|nr:prepilin peptidase [Kiritimatiellia bacterium]